MANSVDPDQTAPSVWSGSTLFVYVILSDSLVFEFLGHLLYPQSMFLSRNKKNNVYFCIPQFYYAEVQWNLCKRATFETDFK